MFQSFPAVHRSANSKIASSVWLSLESLSVPPTDCFSGSPTPKLQIFFSDIKKWKYWNRNTASSHELKYALQKQMMHLLWLCNNTHPSGSVPQSWKVGNPSKSSLWPLTTGSLQSWARVSPHYIMSVFSESKIGGSQTAECTLQWQTSHLLVSASNIISSVLRKLCHSWLWDEGEYISGANATANTVLKYNFMCLISLPLLRRSARRSQPGPCFLPLTPGRVVFTRTHTITWHQNSEQETSTCAGAEVDPRQSDISQKKYEKRWWISEGGCWKQTAQLFVTSGLQILSWSDWAARRWKCVLA